MPENQGQSALACDLARNTGTPTEMQRPTARRLPEGRFQYAGTKAPIAARYTRTTCRPPISGSRALRGSRRGQYFSQPASLYQASVSAIPSFQRRPRLEPELLRGSPRVAGPVAIERFSNFSRDRIPGFPVSRDQSSAQPPTATPAAPESAEPRLLPHDPGRHGAQPAPGKRLACARKYDRPRRFGARAAAKIPLPDPSHRSPGPIVRRREISTARPWLMDLSNRNTSVSRGP